MLCRLDWLFLHEAMLNFLESLVKLFNLDIYIYIYIFYFFYFVFFIFIFFIKEAEIYEILPWNPLRYRFSLDEAF